MSLYKSSSNFLPFIKIEELSLSENQCLLLFNIMKYSICLLIVFPILSLFSKNTLEPGESLQRGESLTSPNGLYRLVLQDDGNLVLYQKK